MTKPDNLNKELTYKTEYIKINRALTAKEEEEGVSPVQYIVANSRHAHMNEIQEKVAASYRQDMLDYINSGGLVTQYDNNGNKVGTTKNISLPGA